MYEIERLFSLVYPFFFREPTEIRIFDEKGSTLQGDHSIYVRAVSSWCLFYILLIQFELFYGLFGKSNMHTTYYFCPR